MLRWISSFGGLLSDRLEQRSRAPTAAVERTERHGAPM